ncbi:MAG: hypothetical protein AB1416_11930 [Actinomycetota bacterium]
MGLDVRFIGWVDPIDEPDLHRRYRFRVDGQDVDVVVTRATATTWLQAHPSASSAELDLWARMAGGKAVRARLWERPLDVSDVYLEHPTGPPGRPGDEGRPRYGEGGLPRR